MGRRQQPIALRVACIISIAQNMERHWCSDYLKHFHDQGQFLHILGPFECLTPSLTRDLISCLVSRNLMKRYFLHVLIDGRLNSLDLSMCRRAADKDSIINLVAVRCPHLTRLTMGKCGQVSPKAISNVVSALPNIVYLDLCHTKVNDQVLLKIGDNCKKLRELNISGCPVTDMGLKNLCDGSNSRLPELLSIDLGLHSKKVTREGIASLLSNCKKLQVLHIPDTCDVLYTMHQNTKSNGVDALNLKKIYMSRLDIPSCPTSEAVRISCLLCPSVTEVHMLEGLTDEGLLFLSGLNNLRVAHLGNRHQDAGISFEGGVLPFLQIRGVGFEELCLTDVDLVDIRSIGNCCLNLKIFRVLSTGSEYSTFSSNTVFEGANNVKDIPFQHLRVLELLFCAEQNDFPSAFLRLILSNCSALTTMTLSRIQCLDDELFGEILKENTLCGLKTLVLESCHHITGEALYNYCKEENALQQLVVQLCRNISCMDSEAMRRMVKIENYDLTIEWS